MKSRSCDKSSRYNEMLEIINSARWWNLICLCMGLLILLITKDFEDNIPLYLEHLKLILISTGIVSIFVFNRANQLVDLTLRNN